MALPRPLSPHAPIGRQVDRLGRKKYFASAKNGARHTLQPEYVYTMEFYEDKVPTERTQPYRPIALKPGPQP